MKEQELSYRRESQPLRLSVTGRQTTSSGCMCETRQDNGTVLNTKGVQLVPRSVTLSKRLGSMLLLRLGL